MDTTQHQLPHLQSLIATFANSQPPSQTFPKHNEVLHYHCRRCRRHLRPSFSGSPGLLRGQSKLNTSSYIALELIQRSLSQTTTTTGGGACPDGLKVLGFARLDGYEIRGFDVSADAPLKCYKGTDTTFDRPPVLRC